MKKIRDFIEMRRLLRTNAELEALNLIYDNGHENMLYCKDFKFKMKKHSIKIKERKEKVVNNNENL